MFGKIIRFLIILVLSSLPVFWAKHIAEFSYEFDITNVNKEFEVNIENKLANLQLNNQVFKTLTKIDTPFLYDVIVKNKVYVHLEASQPKQASSGTTAIFNKTIKIPYEERKRINAIPLQLKSEEDVKSFLLSQNIQLIPDYPEEIMVGPSETFTMRIDENNKFMFFDFRLSFALIAAIYFLTLLALYPILLALDGLYRFISKGQPFLKYII